MSGAPPINNGQTFSDNKVEWAGRKHVLACSAKFMRNDSVTSHREHSQLGEVSLYSWFPVWQNWIWPQKKICCYLDVVMKQLNPNLLRPAKLPPTVTVLCFTAPIAFEFMCLPTPSRFDKFASKLLCSRLKSLPVHVFLSSPSSWTAHPSSTEDQRLRRRIPSLPQRRFLSSTTGKQKKTESSLPISIVCQQQINSDLLV